MVPAGTVEIVVLFTLQSVYAATFAALAYTKNESAWEPVAEPIELRLPWTMSLSERPLTANVPVEDPFVGTVAVVNAAVP